MNRFLRFAIVLLVVAAVGTFAYLKLAPKPVNAATTLPTASVQRGTLAATVNAAGNIGAHRQVDLNFGQTGTIKDVKVQAGDRVKAGQVLAELDTSDLELQVQNAQLNVKLAQAKLAQAKNPNSAQDIASARAKIDAAQAQLNKLQTGPSQADVSAAQSAVAGAQSAYTAAVKSAGTSDSQLTAAAAALDKAQQAVQKAQAAYDKVAGAPDIGARQESVTLQSATTDYNQAKANYDALAATAGSDANSKVAQARSTLQQAQASLVKLQTPANKDDITSAQATVTQAQNDLDKLLAGSDANTLDIAQNGVDQANIALKQAQVTLQQAQVVAPFDAAVTQVNITPGQTISSGGNTSAAIQIADLDHLEIVVNLAEVDVNRVQSGQTAEVTLDALPDATLEGTVTQIAPSGVQVQGVVNYPVTVALTDPPVGVKTGMTANLNIVVDQRENVLMVPNRAVRTQGRQKSVTVLFEGQQIQVPVQTGLSNDTNTEITTGLREGDTVLISSTGTTATGGGFRAPGGPGGPGFIGGGGR
jgi:HlyD family secretion protein